MLLSILLIAFVAVALQGIGLFVLYRLALTIGSHITQVEADKHAASSRLALAAAGIENLAVKLRETRETLSERLAQRVEASVTPSVAVQTTPESFPREPLTFTPRSGLAVLRDRQIERRTLAEAQALTRGD